jgi:exopolysaccharide biosynthesis predicted pyruvyltransferase EpsI
MNAISELREVILNTLRPLVMDRRVALLDFPNYSNCGDSAIWAGELRALRTLGSVIETVPGSASDMRRVAALDSDVVILLTGGGNFGDLYPRHQMYRHEVLRTMTRNRIVQLPQSIHFSSPSAAADSGEELRRHPDFHLLTRDRKSAELAKTLLERDSTMCPDMALMLEFNRLDPAREVFVLARTDIEARVSLQDSAQAHGLEFSDWYDSAQAASRTRVGAMRRAVGSAGSLHHLVLDSRRSTLRQAAYDWLADQEVTRGLRTISQGKVLLTDRLHAHILAEIAGIPHVVVDTGYGKIRGFHDAWLSPRSTTRFASSPDAGCTAALEMARNS